MIFEFRSPLKNQGRRFGYNYFLPNKYLELSSKRHWLFCWQAHIVCIGMRAVRAWSYITGSGDLLISFSVTVNMPQWLTRSTWLFQTQPHVCMYSFIHCSSLQQHCVQKYTSTSSLKANISNSFCNGNYFSSHLVHLTDKLHTFVTIVYCFVLSWNWHINGTMT